MRFFLDTEFIESGPYRPIQLISIGIVSEDGREYYAQSSEYAVSDASEWVKENVIKHLRDIAPKTLRQIAQDIWALVFPQWEPIMPRTFDGIFDKPSFWGYYADYDWVVFCQIFGTMMDLPKGFPMYCNDLKQLCASVGNPPLPAQASAEHDALNDARWNKELYDFLIIMSAGREKHD